MLLVTSTLISEWCTKGSPLIFSFVRSFVGWFVCLFVCLFCFVLFCFGLFVCLFCWVGLGWVKFGLVWFGLVWCVCLFCFVLVRLASACCNDRLNRPRACWGQYAKAVLHRCSSAHNDNDSDSDEEVASANGRKAATAQAFADVFNGNWRDWTEEGLVHYCFLGCQCGCRTTEELKSKAASLFCIFVMASRPKVPALSRWLRCSDTTKWFLLAFTVHGIYMKATMAMYNLKCPKDNPIRQNMHQLVAAVNADVFTVSQNTDAASAFLLPELPECKIMRVRAKKSSEWVLHPDTPCNIALSLHVTEPTEHFAFWLFKQQSEPCFNLIYAAMPGEVPFHDGLVMMR